MHNFIQNSPLEIEAYWQNMLRWGQISYTIANSLKPINNAGKLAIIETIIEKIWFFVEHKQLQNR